MTGMGLWVWKARPVIKYLVRKDGGLTLSQGTAVDKGTLILWSIAYFETWNLRAREQLRVSCPLWKKLISRRLSDLVRRRNGNDPDSGSKAL